MFAAAPSWFADNVALIACVTLVAVTFLIVRMVKKTALRIALLAVVVGLAVFVYANRLSLESCAKTCKCQVASQDVTVPACNVDLTP